MENLSTLHAVAHCSNPEKVIMSWPDNTQLEISSTDARLLLNLIPVLEPDNQQIAIKWINHSARRFQSVLAIAKRYSN
ncbi:hypothetical protein [uncultured Photobacterium sp.]|uniref:hypothetical protein n=1 Tax=uncultured Photobacterium sp. TaxID=173973 RepID=UPI00263885BB|nr:hypothetical protein [uncultured Photobacterium sp.]